jgi:hypothetical protein
MVDEAADGPGRIAPAKYDPTRSDAVQIGLPFTYDCGEFEKTPRHVAEAGPKAARIATLKTIIGGHQ